MKSKKRLATIMALSLPAVLMMPAAHATDASYCGHGTGPVGVHSGNSYRYVYHNWDGPQNGPGHAHQYHDQKWMYLDGYGYAWVTQDNEWKGCP